MYSAVIIEDDPSYADVMVVMLQMEGFEVYAAASGPAGIALIEERRPDVILCDIMMPGMDGFGVLQALKESNEIASIPFIFVSALAERSDVRRGMSEGSDDYLTKPFTADELLAAVMGRIQRSQMLVPGEGDLLNRKKQAILRDKVTPRELEVLLLVGQGGTSKEIAGKLEVTVKTVEVHRSNLMRKLDASNAASLTRWAVIAEAMMGSERRLRRRSSCLDGSAGKRSMLDTGPADLGLSTARAR
jgi:two-component system, OmpR family, response regulator